MPTCIVFPCPAVIYDNPEYHVWCPTMSLCDVPLISVCDIPEYHVSTNHVWSRSMLTCAMVEWFPCIMPLMSSYGVHWISFFHLQMTVLMCSTFLLAWTPYGIFAAWETFHGPEYITSPLFSALPAMFAKGVSVNNPMFHFFFNRKFRMQAVKLFTRSNRVMDTPHPPIVKPPSGSPPPIFNVDTPEMAAGELRPPNRKNHEEFSEICSSDESFLSTAHSAPTTRITTLNVKQLIPRPATISSCN